MLRDARSARALLAGCLVVSGAAALTLELAWSRSLRLIFGSSTLAVSTVLVAYMLGLGLGGLAAGGATARVRRPARAYGLVEIGIGAYALGVSWLLGALPSVEVQLAAMTSTGAAQLVRFVLVLAVLLLPTFLMGATLPLLTAAWVGTSARVAGGVGLLYGVNTLGAVIGILAATFLFLPNLGLAMTQRLGAGLAIAVGLVASFVVAPSIGVPAPVLDSKDTERKRPQRRDADTSAKLEPTHRWNRWLLSYATVGFTALAYEVCWFRALSMVVGSSIYAFATMLAGFLLGIALGSLLSRDWWERRRQPAADYALGLIVLGVAAWGTAAALGVAPRFFVRFVDLAGLSPTAILSISGGIAVLAMLAPTLVLGGLFPGVLRLVAADRAPAASAGDVYFANTLGSATGAFVAGFILIPLLGLPTSMAALIAVNLAVAAALLAKLDTWPRARRRNGAGLAAVAAVGVMVVPPPWNPVELNRGVYQLLLDADDWRVDYEAIAGVPPDALLLHREGINTTVAVERRNGERILRVNGKPDAGTGGDMSTQILLGQLPFLFGASAERVLVIGLASGVTVGSASLFEPRRLDVVELEPSMVEASRFFDDLNHQPLQRPGVHLLVEDGRVHLARRPEPYDVIISEPSNPWISGVANLFTQEFFRAARESLQPEGVLLQWVQLYGLAPSAWTSMLAALSSEFRYVYVFGYSGLSGGDSLVMASQRPLAADDFPRWEQLPPAVRADLERIGLCDTADLWSLLRLGPAEVVQLAAEAPVINRDDNLYVELSAPRTMHDAAAIEGVRQRLQEFRAGALPPLTDAGVPLDDETLGDLALAYATGRREVALARAWLAERPALEAWRQTLEAMILARGGAGTEPERRTARSLLAAARQARPEAVGLRLHHAAILRDLGEADAAVAEVDAFLGDRPDHKRARALRVRLQLEGGHLAAARQEAEDLLRGSYARYDGELRLLAALAAARMGDLSGAVVHLRAHVVEHPDDTYAWQMMGEMLEESGERAASREAFDNAERARRNRARRSYVEALRLKRFGETAAAAALLQRVVEQLPDFAPAQEALASIPPSRNP